MSIEIGLSILTIVFSILSGAGSIYQQNHQLYYLIAHRVNVIDMQQNLMNQLINYNFEIIKINWIFLVFFFFLSFIVIFKLLKIFLINQDKKTETILFFKNFLISFFSVFIFYILFYILIVVLSSIMVKKNSSDLGLNILNSFSYGNYENLNIFSVYNTDLLKNLSNVEGFKIYTSFIIVLFSVSMFSIIFLILKIFYLVFKIPLDSLSIMEGNIKQIDITKNNILKTFLSFLLIILIWILTPFIFDKLVQKDQNIYDLISQLLLVLLFLLIIFISFYGVFNGKKSKI